jgi:predicted HTH domain antitoxin
MKQLLLSIDLPDMITISEIELKMVLASRLYENGQLSLGQAAELAGLSKRAFAELLGNYNVSLFSQTIDELQRDINNAC